MNMHQIIVLAIVTGLSALAGYRAQLTGTILIVGFFEVVAQIILGVACVAILILWCAQFSIPVALTNVAYVSPSLACLSNSANASSSSAAATEQLSLNVQSQHRSEFLT